MSIQKDANTKRTKKTRETRKKTHKDPTIAENPKHRNKKSKTLYNMEFLNTMKFENKTKFCPPGL